MLPLFSIDALLSYAAPRDSMIRFKKIAETDFIDRQIFNDDLFCDVVLKPLPFEIFNSINVSILIDEDADDNVLYIPSLNVCNDDDKSNEIITLLNDALKSTNALIQVTFNDSDDYYNKMIDVSYLELSQFIPSTWLKDDDFMQRLLSNTIAESRQSHFNDFDYYLTYKQNTGRNNNDEVDDEDLSSCKFVTTYSELRVFDCNIQSFKYYSDSAINNEKETVLYPRLDDDIVRYQNSYSSLNSLYRNKVISSMVLLKSLQCNVDDFDSIVFIQNTSSSDAITMDKSNKRHILHDFNSMGKISEKISLKQIIYKDELKGDHFFSSVIPKQILYPDDLKINQSLRNLTPQVKLPNDLVLSNYLQPDSFTSQYIMSSWDSNSHKSEAKVVTKIKSEKPNLLKDISSDASRIKMLTGANVSTACLFSEDSALKHSLLPSARQRIAGTIFII